MSFLPIAQWGSGSWGAIPWDGDFEASGSPTVIVSDTLTLSDAASVALNRVLLESPTDTLTVSDTIAIGLGLALTDSFSFTDFISLGIGNIYTDALTLSDSVTLQIIDFSILLVAVTDLLPLSDHAQIALGLGYPFTDSLSFSDSATTGAATIAVFITDTLTFVDNESISTSASDSFTLQDSMGIFVGIYFPVNDSFTLSDALGLTLADSTGVNLLLGIQDTISLSDGSIVFVPVAFTFTDTVSLSDSTKLFGSDILSLHDALVFSDAFGVNSPLSLGTADLGTQFFTLIDSVQTQSSIAGTSPTDSVSIGDSIALQIAVFLAIHDTLTISDNAIPILSESLLLNISDNLILSDTFTGSVPLLNTSYLRRYLNDVV